MAKRGKLEIIRDTLKIIRENRNLIRPTVLLRKSKMSSSRFKDFYAELLQKGFVNDVHKKDERFIELTLKGMKFLERYKTIVDFLEEFEL